MKVLDARLWAEHLQSENILKKPISEALLVTPKWRPCLEDLELKSDLHIDPKTKMIWRTKIQSELD
jgi:hypothetical protein